MKQYIRSQWADLRSATRRVLQPLAVVVLVAPILASCLQFETTVQVKPDGSGTIAEQFLMSSEIVAMMAQMAPEGEEFSLLDDEQLRADAAKFGSDVRYDGAEALQNDFGQGYIARYSFDDINALQIEQNPGDTIADRTGGEPAEPAEEPSYITFSQVAGDPTTLTVNWPIEEAEAASSGDDAAASEEPMPEPDPAELEMMKSFFKDMRMSIFLDVVGEIVETNATHRDGSRITLMDFNFAALLSDEAALMSMMGEEQPTISEMKALSQRIPGFKMEFEPVVEVSYH